MGLRGEMDVAVGTDHPDRFAPGSVVYRGDRALTVRTVRRQGDRTVVSFEEVTDRDGAEALTGAELTIPADQARALDEDEYWDHDLIGCSVVTSDGEVVGEVTDVLHQPANSVLVVAGEREVLVPLIKDVVREVVVGERIVIDPLPGLLSD